MRIGFRLLSRIVACTTLVAVCVVSTVPRSTRAAVDMKNVECLVVQSKVVEMSSQVKNESSMVSFEQEANEVSEDAVSDVEEQPVIEISYTSRADDNILRKEPDAEESKLELMAIDDRAVGIFAGLTEDKITEIKKCINMAKKDDNYNAQVLNITGNDRALVEALVYGEAGGEDFVGQCLVAQCIKDTLLRLGNTNVKKLIKIFGYKGSIDEGTSESCKEAVEYIFDNGGYAAKHRIIYFYAFEKKTSNWHETQDFVIQWGGHRVFDDIGWE